MKHLFSVSLLLFVAAVCQAEPVRYFNADGSEFSEICIAAIESRGAAADKAAELGIQGFDYDRLRCNGMSATRFLQEQKAKPVEATEMFAVNAGDSSPETELCVAALTSPEKFQAVKERYFERAKELESKLQCNGKPLKRFVMQYGSESLTGSL